MPEITAAKVKELREKTGAGMMDCKKALVENNGELEQAVDWIRTKGLAAAAKKSGRIAAEGAVAIAHNENKVVIVELNSETDFVAKNDKFQSLATGIAQAALESGSDIDAINKAPFPGSGRNVEEEIVEGISVIGENLRLRRAQELSGDIVVTYVHNAVAENLGKIAVAVALSTEGNNEKAKEFGKQVAMHIAAVGPEALTVEELDPALIERERNVLTEQARESGKPENVIEKIIEGRIRKFYSEVVLLEQAFVIDGKTPVKTALKEAEASIGGATSITGYIRLTLGEGVEKKEEDFAAEVAAAANG